jgi:hypothetical protein
MALLADSSVLNPSVAGGGDSQLQHKLCQHYSSMTPVGLNQPPIQSVPRFFPRGIQGLKTVASQIKLNQTESFASWTLSIV